MKKLILLGCKCRNNTTIKGDFIVNVNETDVNRDGKRIYFIGKVNTLYMEYLDEEMAAEAMYHLSDAMCEEIKKDNSPPDGYKMPMWDKFTNLLETFPVSP